MKLSHFLLVLPLLLVACQSEVKPVVNHDDYAVYLSVSKVVGYSIDADMKFWSDRLLRMPGDEASLTKLACLYSSRFRKTGNVSDIQMSDSLLLHLHRRSPGAPGPLLGLAQNSITQHQFKEAKAFARKALAIGDRKAAAMLVLTDVALELGNTSEAKWLLKKFTNQHSFAHLIRQVKLDDHEGNLDSAICKMEMAYSRVKGNKTLACWAQSNLADMYGHAGRISEAYRTYLDVLRVDHSYDYALKGIAWIAISHDQNYHEAKKIIKVLASRSRMPEAYLMLAEIAEAEGNDVEKKNQLKTFISLTDRPGYQTMYAKYLVLLYAEEMNNAEKALAISQNEIRNRPNAQSYDLMAWSLLKAGKKAEALEIARQFVVDRTFEPDASYHLGMIYLANGLEDEAKQSLKKALESSFELGPSITKEIQRQLEQF